MDIRDFCPKLFSISNNNELENVSSSENTSKIKISKIYLSSIWKYHPKKFDDIRWCLSTSKNSLSLTTLSEKEMSIWKAKWVHRIFGHYSHIDMNEARQGEFYFLYIETDVNYTQFTVLDNMGNEEQAIRMDIGYSPEKNQLFREISESLFEDFGQQLEHVVVYGSLYHLIKDDAPRYSKKMSQFVFEKYGIDYAQFGFISNQFMTTKMIVIDDNLLQEETLKTISISFDKVINNSNEKEYYMMLSERAIEIFNTDTNMCYAIHEYPQNWLYSKEGFQQILSNIGNYLDCQLDAIPI